VRDGGLVKRAPRFSNFLLACTGISSSGSAVERHAGETAAGTRTLSAAASRGFGGAGDTLETRF
jgi:hypothetical protein